MQRTPMILASVILGLAAMNVMAHDDDHDDDGDEVSIKLSDAPQAVQDAIAKAVGSNELEEVSRETEDGKTVYEAEYEIEGMDASVEVAEDGSILEESKELDPAALPKSVTDAVSREYPDGKITEAELTKSDSKSTYEVEVSAGTARHELHISEDGAIQKDDDDDNADHS